MLIALVFLVLIESATQWVRVLSGRKTAPAAEAPFVTSRFAAEETA